MGYQDCDRASIGRFLGLKDDKQTERFLVVGEPEVYHKTGTWGPKTQFLFPILHDGELRVFPANKKSYPDIRALADKFSTHAVVVTRRGKASSVNTVYLFDSVEMSEAEKLAVAEVIEADVVQMMEDIAVPF